MTPSPTQRSSIGATGPDAPDELLALGDRVAREAGSLALAGRRGSVLERHTKSSTTDLVTQHDRAAEALIVEQLAHRTSERRDRRRGGRRHSTARAGTRGSSIRSTARRTSSTTCRRGARSVAVAYHGTTVAGAVYVPVADEMFAAQLGGGATLDGTPIRCSDETELSLALVATGFSYVPARRAVQAAAIARLIGEVRDIRRSGSAAIDLCLAAAGRVDAYFEEHLNSWDAAAGELDRPRGGSHHERFRGWSGRPVQHRRRRHQGSTPRCSTSSNAASTEGTARPSRLPRRSSQRSSQRSSSRHRHAWWPERRPMGHHGGGGYTHPCR